MVKELNYANVVSCGIIQNTDGRGMSLLRARRERPRSRAAEQRDELASPHRLPSSGWGAPHTTTRLREDIAVRHADRGGRDPQRPFLGLPGGIASQTPVANTKTGHVRGFHPLPDLYAVHRWRGPSLPIGFALVIKTAS
jgi:hypothetical protein